MIETNPLDRINRGFESEIIVRKIMVIFGITLTNEECARMIAVGDLHACIMEKLGPELNEGCVIRAAFYRLRRVLIDDYDVNRRDIRPDRLLLEILPNLEPRCSRRKEWNLLFKRLDLYIPNLGGGEWSALFAIVCSTLLVVSVKH